MKEKLDDIVKKLDKFVFNVKNLNILIAVMLSVFMIGLTIFYSKEYTRYQEDNLRYERMLQEIQANQLNVIYDNVSENSGSKGSGDIEEPMFKNAKDAVATAFDNFYKYKSFEYYSYGTSNAEALGQHVEVVNSATTVKYSDELQYQKSCRIETKTSFGQTSSLEVVFKDGKKFKRNGTNERVEGGYCVADYYGTFNESPTKVPYIVGILVNQDTIQFQRSFSFVRDKNNKIQYYKATVTVDPEEAVKEYGINIMEEGGTSFPVFSKIEVACIIDRDGHLVSFETVEVMKVSKRVVIDVTTSITTTINHIFVSHDVPPKTQMPSF